MTRPSLRVPATRAMRALVVALALSAAASCDQVGQVLGQSASADWSRVYSVAPGSDVQVVGGNGDIDVVTSSDAQVHVSAVRTVRAATAERATTMAPKVAIREDVTERGVVLQTLGLGDVPGVNVVVHYHLAVPGGTRLRLSTVNGGVTVDHADAAVDAMTVNGSVRVHDVRSALAVRVTNGTIAADAVVAGAEPISLQSVNGTVALTVPAGTNATVEASCTNGEVTTAGLTVVPEVPATRTRLRGRLGTGGAPIRLTTTNGSIRLNATRAE